METRRVKGIDYWVLALLSVALLMASWRQWLPLDLTETLGFVTGVICVYMVVREHIWNFPIGIANNIFLLVLFVRARIYGDAGLQIVYIVLGLHGWYAWLYGGERHTALRVNRSSPLLGVAMAALVVLGTPLMTIWLRAKHDAAPELDSFTTMLSLAAQCLLNLKMIENWYLWLLADAIYIYLYIIRGLYLTAGLYSIFIVLCLLGFQQWRNTLRPRLEMKVEVAA